MLRLQYQIGSRTLEDILPYLDKDVNKEDIVVAKSGNNAIILSRTPAGESFITFFYLKNFGNPLMSLKEV